MVADEAYIKVKGIWKYLYRAMDKQGKTVDFLLTAERDKAAAMRFFEMTMQANEVPEKISMDKSGANKAAIEEINASGDSSDYRSPPPESRSSVANAAPSRPVC